jgi:hypothetical protein
MKSKMFYLSDKTANEVKVLAFIAEVSQSSVVESALLEYMDNMKNALSEDDLKAELIKKMLGE